MRAHPDEVLQERGYFGADRLRLLGRRCELLWLPRDGAGLDSVYDALDGLHVGLEDVLVLSARVLLHAAEGDLVRARGVDFDPVGPREQPRGGSVRADGAALLVGHGEEHDALQRATKVDCGAGRI